MKRGTPTHTKMRRLKRELNCPLYVAVGILECLWHLTANERPHGDIGALSDRDIADALEWPHDPGQLIAALVTAGWLDQCQRCRLVVHDWKDHCDDAVRKRVQRASGQWATPVTDPADSGGQRRTTADNGSLPKPTPEPKPEPKPTPTAWPVPTDGGGSGPITDAERAEMHADADRRGDVMRLAMDDGFSLGDAKRLADLPGATLERVRWLLSKTYPAGRRQASVFKGCKEQWDVPQEPLAIDQTAADHAAAQAAVQRGLARAAARRAAK